MHKLPVRQTIGLSCSKGNQSSLWDQYRLVVFLLPVLAEKKTHSSPPSMIYWAMTSQEAVGHLNAYDTLFYCQYFIV